MKKAIIPILLLVLLIAGCAKDTDNTSPWLATYIGPLNVHNQINRVVISKVDNNTLQIQAQIDSASLVYTIATFQATVLNSSTIAVNQNGAINNIVDSTFHFVASGALSGTNLIVSGSATNTTNAADVKYFYFSGTR